MTVFADSVVLVMRAGMTRKRALVKVRDLLLRINAPIAGVVVNDVDVRLENFYTYRYGMYGYQYGYGYPVRAALFNHRRGTCGRGKGRVIWQRSSRMRTATAAILLAQAGGGFAQQTGSGSGGDGATSEHRLRRPAST